MFCFISGGKWNASVEEWPWKDYPRYFFGPGVLFPCGTILPFLDSFQTTPLHPVDDLYYSGICSEKAGVKFRWSTSSNRYKWIWRLLFHRDLGLPIWHLRNINIGCCDRLLSIRNMSVKNSEISLYISIKYYRDRCRYLIMFRYFDHFSVLMKKTKKKRRKIVASPLLVVGWSKKLASWKVGRQLDIDYVYNSGLKWGKDEVKKCRQRHVRFAFKQSK